MKTYVTFGQSHVHSVNGKTFDKNCVAVINSNSKEAGRELVFELFDDTFFFEYFEDEFDQALLRYFPRGLIEVE